MSDKTLPKIALFGGTFDPPHLAHLEVARAVRDQLEMDDVIWIPANQNPFKLRLKMSPPKKRLKMVELTIREEPKMSLSDIEVSRGGQSYTVETLMELREILPAQFWIVVGSDALDQVLEWKAYAKLFRFARFAAVLRPPHDHSRALLHVPDQFHEQIDFVEMPPMTHSGTQVRDLVERGEPYDHLVTPAVQQYIQENKLYV